MAPFCHPSVLSTGSAALYLLITVGVVTYWRGLWVLMDQLLGYDDNAALSGWYSLAIGFGGAVALYVGQAMRATCFASVASTATTVATQPSLVNVAHGLCASHWMLVYIPVRQPMILCVC